MEVEKYLKRFGLVVVLALPIILLTQGINTVKVIGYKVAMASLAIGLAEGFWITHFKPVFGRVEDLPVDVQKNILIFRGIFSGAIILGFTLGL